MERVKSQVPAYLCKSSKMVFSYKGREKQHSQRHSQLPHLTNKPARGRSRVSCMRQCHIWGEMTTSLPRSDSCDKRERLSAGKSAGPRRESSVLCHYSHFFFHAPLCCEYTVITVSMASSGDEDTEVFLPEKSLACPKNSVSHLPYTLSPNKSRGPNKRYYLSLQILSQL